MKRKICTLGILFFIMTSLFYGCGKKEIDYNVEKKTSKAKTESEIAQFQTDERWTDEWKVTDVSGTEYTLDVNAKIRVPKLEYMSVIEVENAENDKSFRKQFLDSFFEGNDVYYYDEAHKTKSDIEPLITETEERLDDYDITEGSLPSYAEMLEEYRKRWQNAPENYTIAEEFESCDEYAGYKNNLLVEVCFEDKYISAKPVEREYCGPQSLRNYERVNNGDGTFYYSESKEKFYDNECKYSGEEAKKIADRFMQDLGRSNQICVKQQELIWYGADYDDKGYQAVKRDAYASYGYSFTYSTKLAGIASTEFPDFAEFDVYGRETYEGEVCNGDEMTVMVTDAGVIEVFMRGAINIRNTISDSVKLLPLDTVKNIMKNELSEHGEKYDFTNSQAFNSLELMYYKLKDDTVEGVFSYVPVWCLSDKIENDWHYHPVFVNAMDGSVIYLTDIE